MLSVIMLKSVLSSAIPIKDIQFYAREITERLSNEQDDFVTVENTS